MSEQTTNPLLVKLEVLKKALKEERKRKNELERRCCYQAGKFG